MLNGLPRRAVRSRRGGSLIAQAIAILRAKGGSWWQPGPAHTFTGSDGTGAAGDGSDAGYGVDLCASYGPELVPSGWLGASDSFTTPELAAVKTVDAVAGTIGLELSGTAFTAFSDPIKNLLGDNVPTAGGEVLELSAAGSESVSPAGASTKLLLVEMDAGLGYLRGALVPLGGKAVVVLGSDCRFIRLAVYVGNWAAGSTVSANIALQKPSLRQIIGRPLFQSTTGFKPKLKRVPKRLGPELVVQGAGDSTLGWATYDDSALSAAGGSFFLTSGTIANPGWHQILQLTAGRSYQLSGTVVPGGSASAPSVETDLGGQWHNVGGRTGVGHYHEVGTATGATFIKLRTESASGVTAYFDNISVREVIEWTWAWVFDGVDDVLATVSQPASAEETLIICADVTAATISTAKVRIEKGDAVTGVRIYGDSAPFYAQHYAAAGVQFSPIAGALEKRGVASLRAAQGAQATRMNGLQVATKSTDYVSSAQPVRIGSGLFGATAMEVFAAIYCPEALTDAELLVIEKAMAQVGGITI